MLVMIYRAGKKVDETMLKPARGWSKVLLHLAFGTPAAVPENPTCHLNVGGSGTTLQRTKSILVALAIALSMEPPVEELCLVFQGLL